MGRLLAILMIFALAVTNSAAVASALCQHQDAAAHAAALHSADAAVAAEAAGEESAAKVASLDGSVADASANLLTGFILPPESAAPEATSRGAALRHGNKPAALDSRSVLPLLEPPLA